MSGRSMRERNLLYLFLALNVALAGAFITYLFLSSTGQPQVVSASFTETAAPKAATNIPVRVSPAANAPKTNLAVAVAVQEIKSSSPVSTNQVESKPVFTSKKITWEQVESDDYLKYI